MEMIFGSMRELLGVVWEWVVAALMVMMLGGLGLF